MSFYYTLATRVKNTCVIIVFFFVFDKRSMSCLFFFSNLNYSCIPKFPFPFWAIRIQDQLTRESEIIKEMYINNLIADILIAKINKNFKKVK